ncbi:hypothetical protein KCU61_g363, partial [Aureobasidium melanogenum]
LQAFMYTYLLIYSIVCRTTNGQFVQETWNSQADQILKDVIAQRARDVNKQPHKVSQSRIDFDIDEKV